jgi:thiol-disulfide isomerase/thioredoxin
MLTNLSRCFERKFTAVRLVNNRILLSFMLSLTAISPEQMSFASISFFDGQDIDYWSEGKRVQPFVPRTVDPAKKSALPPLSGSVIRQRDALPFDWKKYEDPENPEFWDDGGDYVPPRPLREAVAHPTQENLEKYAQWQAKRIAVIADFNRQLVSQSLAQGVNSKPSTSVDSMKNNARTNFREVQLLYFYQSTCPHCLAAKPQVEELRRKGVNVTFVQLDSDESPPIHHPSVKYSSAFSKQFAVTATPTWIFRRRESSVRLQGGQSDDVLHAEISKLFNPNMSSNAQQKNSIKGVSQ